LAVLFAIFIVIFSSKQIQKISVSLAEQRLASFILEKKSETISQLTKDFKLIGDAEDRIKNAFPPVDNILDFVSAMENLLIQNSIQGTASFNSPPESGEYIDYNISLNAGVGFLINYLKGFEKLPFFTGITSINLNAQGGGWDGNSAVSIRSRVYTRTW
jgi:hypothetical protein